MATIEALAIRNALVDSYNAYAQGLDSKDWDLLRSCFAEAVYIDYGEISAATGDPSTPRRIDDWMEHLVTVISKFDITRHTITNHRVVISAGEVSCRAYMSADHVKFADPANPVALRNVIRELQRRGQSEEARPLVLRLVETAPRPGDFPGAKGYHRYQAENHTPSHR